MNALPPQQAALDRLAAVPGVVGVALFDAAGALRGSAFPPLFDAATLSQLAARLTADPCLRELLVGGEATLSLRFRDGHVALRSLGGAWALVLCTAGMNEQLLSMSLAQLAHRLQATGGASPALGRLQGIARAELGEHAARAVDLLSAAGPTPEDLARAVAEVEKMVRLFISRKKADELARRMREALEA